MSIFYLAAGINHFIAAPFYTRIMPTYLPYHLALVYLSGIVEAGLAVVLLCRKTRRVAAWGIVALLIVIFPANIQMLVNYLHAKSPYTWIAILRLPLQLLLIWWAYSFTKPASEPLRKPSP